MRCIALKAPLFHPLCELGDLSPVALYVLSLRAPCWVGPVWAVGCPGPLLRARQTWCSATEVLTSVSFTIPLLAKSRLRLALTARSPFRLTEKMRRRGVIGAAAFDAFVQ